MNFTGIPLWLNEHVPRPVRNAMKRLGLTSLVEKWIRRISATHPWPLKGPLDGYFLRIQTPDQQQYVFGQRETEVSDAIISLVKPGWVCADVGAHIGYFTLLMAKLVGPEGRVVAFEADRDNADLLRVNVSLNRYQDRVRVEQRAVADGSQDSVTLYAGPSSFQVSILPQGRRIAEVPAISLEQYFGRGDRLDFIKMDIEGGESKAIPGMKRLFIETRPVLLVEVHEGSWRDIHKISSFDYLLCDPAGRPVQARADQERLNHCIAIPAEKLYLIPPKNP
jgi:FkbM family methyltransferase